VGLEDERDGGREDGLESVFVSGACESELKEWY
jgi:hypothetical protein